MTRQNAGWDARSLRIVFGVLAAIAIVFLIAPTIIVLLTSFTATESLKFPPQGYSLRWYAALLDADQMQRAAWNSLIVPSGRRWSRSCSARRRACDRAQQSPLGAGRRRAVHVAADPAGAGIRVCGADLHQSAWLRAVRFPSWFLATSSSACRSCCARLSLRSRKLDQARCSMRRRASAPPAG